MKKLLWFCFLVLMGWACNGTNDDSLGHFDSDGDDSTGDDDTGTGDSGDDDSSDSAGDDDAPAGKYTLETGLFELTIEMCQVNTCENAQGYGIHVHVGDRTPMELQTDGANIEANVDGMPFSGARTGDQFTLTGGMVMPLGTSQGMDCDLWVDATLDGELDADNHFSYAVAAQFTEYSGKDCGLYIGPSGIIPALPCDQAWDGLGYRVGDLKTN